MNFTERIFKLFHKKESDRKFTMKILNEKINNSGIFHNEKLDYQ